MVDVSARAALAMVGTDMRIECVLNHAASKLKWFAVDLPSRVA